MVNVTARSIYFLYIKYHHRNRGDILRMKLYYVRTAKGLTLNELSKLTNISKTTLNSIENNKIMPKIDIIEHLAKCLDVGIVDLFDSEYKYRKG